MVLALSDPFHRFSRRESRSYTESLIVEAKLPFISQCNSVEFSEQLRPSADAEKDLRRAGTLLGIEDPGPPLYMARMLVATGVAMAQAPAAPKARVIGSAWANNSPTEESVY